MSRLEWPGMASEYAVLPPHQEATTTRGHQIGVGFSGHRRMVRAIDGRATRCDADPGAVYVTGESAISWLEIAEPTEALEIYPDRALVERIAGAPVDVQPHLAVRDGVVFAVAAQLRRAHLRGDELSDVQASSLAHVLVRHLITRYTSVPLPGRAPPGRLPRGAVDLVTDHVRACPSGPISLEALATLVSCSPFHFARSFKATTGMTPHAFVTEQRLVLARDRVVRSTARVDDIAAAVGFGNVSHFRRVFRRRFGTTPGELRRSPA